MDAKNLTLKIEWQDFVGSKCVCCGGDIDHLCDEEDEVSGFTKSSYICEEKNGLLCDYVYMIVLFDRARRDHRGDALTVGTWVEFEGLPVFGEDES